METVLIVEDEVRTRDLSMELLRKDGREVVTQVTDKKQWNG